MHLIELLILDAVKTISRPLQVHFSLHWHALFWTWTFWTWIWRVWDVAEIVDCHLRKCCGGISIPWVRLGRSGTLFAACSSGGVKPLCGIIISCAVVKIILINFVKDFRALKLIRKASRIYTYSYHASFLLLFFYKAMFAHPRLCWKLTSILRGLASRHT